MKIGELDRNSSILQMQNIKPSDKAENKSVPDPDKDEVSPAVRKRDEYVKNEDNGESIGLYSMDYDDDGNPIISFDAPEENAPARSEDIKSEKAEKSERSESCTANTDKVDREIKRLKEKQEQFEQQLRSANDEEKAKQLKKQLAAVQSELLQKDNDSYRRGQAVFS